jgi:hypothetical protein
VKNFNRLLVACLISGSCGAPQADLRIAAAPDPLPVEFVTPCAGVFAGNPCSASDYLQSKLTVSISGINDVGGRGTVSVVVADAANGRPLVPAGSVSGDAEVLLTPGATLTRSFEWKRTVPPGGQADRIPPPQLSFIISVRFTDTQGNSVSETTTIREALPRPWQIF